MEAIEYLCRMEVSSELADRVLRLVSSPNYRPIKPKLIAAALGVTTEEFREVKRVVKALVHRGQLVYGSNHLVMLASAAPPPDTAAAKPPKKSPRKKKIASDTLAGQSDPFEADPFEADPIDSDSEPTLRQPKSEAASAIARLGVDLARRDGRIRFRAAR